MLKSLVYTSAGSSVEVSDDELRAILDVSRRNNAANGVSGMLLYAEGCFLQVLEGEADKVDETFARVSRDTRHGSVLILHEGQIDARNFPEWSMGYRMAQSGDLPPGLFTLKPDTLAELEREAIGSEILALLKSFYRTAYRFEAV
ncbi:MAG: BLUF domain-containing protein [Hyphococcus sp.]